MYRVELKARRAEGREAPQTHVPNVPCGVESFAFVLYSGLRKWFLMYRVELKGAWVYARYDVKLGFLMHRVELKVLLHAGYSLKPYGS